MFYFFSSRFVYADFSYVLSYPSYMPGNTLYKLRVLYEQLEKYWYFGDFGQFTYNLQLADRYLVEAKTLFEYKQYKLARDALFKSDYYIKFLSENLKSAQVHGKKINEKERIVKEAKLKHIEVLSKIKKEVPEVFIWKDEVDPSTELFLRKYIDYSIIIRKDQ